MINRTLEPFNDNYVTRTYDMNLLEGVRNEMAKSIKMLDDAQPNSYDGEVAIQEMKTAVKLTDILCRIMIDRSKVKDSDIFEIDFTKRKAYANEMEQVINEFSERWMLRNRIGGLNDTNKFFVDIVKILNTKDAESCTIVPRLRL